MSIIGKKIVILDMIDFPEYEGKIGVVTEVTQSGFYKGTWGNEYIIPEIDDFIVLEK